MFQCSMGSFKVHLSFIDSSVSWKSNSHCFLYCYVWVDESPVRKCDDPWDRDVPSLQTVIPLESAAAYDMLDVIREVDLDICFNSCWAEFICESESAHRAGATYQTCIYTSSSCILWKWYFWGLTCLQQSGALFCYRYEKRKHADIMIYLQNLITSIFMLEREKIFIVSHTIVIVPKLYSLELPSSCQGGDNSSFVW